MESGPGKAAPSCREIVDLLMDYLEATLPPEEARALERHLAGCPPCVAFVNTYQGTVQVARRLTPEEIPPELTDRLLAFLKRERATPPS